MLENRTVMPLSMLSAMAHPAATWGAVMAFVLGLLLAAEVLTSLTVPATNRART